VGFGQCARLSFFLFPDRDGDDIPDSEPEVILDGFTVRKQ
jgi:hypothetical protein